MQFVKTKATCYICLLYKPLFFSMNCIDKIFSNIDALQKMIFKIETETI